MVYCIINLYISFNALAFLKVQKKLIQGICAIGMVFMNIVVFIYIMQELPHGNLVFKMQSVQPVFVSSIVSNMRKLKSKLGKVYLIKTYQTNKYILFKFYTFSKEEPLSSQIQAVSFQLQASKEARAMSSLKLSPLSTPKTKKPLIATTVFFPTFQFYLILSL